VLCLSGIISWSISNRSKSFEKKNLKVGRFWAGMPLRGDWNRGDYIMKVTFTCTVNKAAILGILRTDCFVDGG